MNVGDTTAVDTSQRRRSGAAPKNIPAAKVTANTASKTLRSGAIAPGSSAEEKTR